MWDLICHFIETFRTVDQQPPVPLRTNPSAEFEEDVPDNTLPSQETRTPKHHRRYLGVIGLAKFIHQIDTFWATIIIPLEFSDHGFNSLIVGLIIMIMSVTSFVSSVYLSASFVKFGGSRSSYNLLIIGNIFYGLQTVCSAACTLLKDNMLFVSIFGMIYGTRGISQAALFTSINTIIIAEFPLSMQKAKTIDTFAYVTGSLCSFVVSAFLYNIFGFELVVILLGGTQVGLTILYAHVLPQHSKSIMIKQRKKERKIELRVLQQLTSIPEALITLISHGIIYTALFYTTPTFSRYVKKKFQIDTWVIGPIICLPYLSISFTAFIWYFLGTIEALRKFSVIFSMVLIAPVYCLIGNITCYEPPLWMFCTLFFISGALLGANLVCNIEELKQAVCRHGLHTESLTVSAFLGSALTSFEFIGEVLGPLIGGFLTDKFGFENSMSIAGIFICLVGLLRLVILVVQDRRHKNILANSKNNCFKFGNHNFI